MSSGLVVLVVPENDRQVRLLEKAIRGIGVRDIEVVSGGDEALHWLSVRSCDVCVLSHELPGKRTGLDTLLNLRSHRPNLPVIIVSRSGSEKVAVGAFHAGVVDYVPTTRGYEIAVASLISQIKVSSSTGPVVPTQIVPAGVQDHALRPTYQNKLRVIGRHLDVQRFRRANILEVEGGFIVRATPTGSRNNETLEFVDQQFPQLLASAAAVRGDGERPGSNANGLLPTGYEDFLRQLAISLTGLRRGSHIQRT
ncbi:MAG: response regulator [Thermomicrobiales bacterium]